MRAKRAWLRKQCSCMNKPIKGLTDGSCTGAAWKVLQKPAEYQIDACCTAAKGEPEQPAGASRSSAQAGGPPPSLPGAQPAGASRSSPVAGGPPPSLPGAPAGASRSSPVAGGPPPGLPSNAPPGSSRSTPMAGGPPPGLPGPGGAPETPSGPTPGLPAESPLPPLPSDMDDPNPEQYLPPLDPGIDFIFYDLPPDYQFPPTDVYPYDIQFPPPPDSSVPEPTPNQIHGPYDQFITYLPWEEYPPEDPSWPYNDYPWSEVPWIPDEFSPPVFGPPEIEWIWLPDIQYEPDPLDWLWPEQPDWQPFPGLEWQPATEPSWTYWW